MSYKTVNIDIKGHLYIISIVHIDAYFKLGQVK